MNQHPSRRLLDTRRVVAAHTLCVLNALVVLTVSLAFAPSALAAETGSITGRVTDAATGEPIQGIQVCAEPSVASCERTDANGEYTISELATGEYQLGFTPIGGLDYFFYRQTGVSVTAGQVTSGVDVGLTEGGRITGRVTSGSTDEPIEGAEACAREVGGDEKQCGTTNASGEYTIPEIGWALYG